MTPSWRNICTGSTFLTIYEYNNLIPFIYSAFSHGSKKFVKKIKKGFLVVCVVIVCR